MARNPTRCVVVLTALTLVYGDFNVVILHTNDVHGRVEQTDKYSGNCSESDAQENKCYGGVARRYTVIEEIRNNHSNVLLLDAGDEFQGSLWFTWYKGLEASYFMDRLGYDAMTLGNHEFDNGVKGLVRPFLENITFPVVACNIDASRAPELDALIQPYVKLNVGGEDIGIIGYITQETQFLTDPTGIASINFLDVETSVRQYVIELQNAGVNKIIGLGHSGFEPSKKLAKNVEGLDVIIDGHSNTFLYNGDPPDREEALDVYPVVVEQSGGGKALVYQAYAYGKYLGMADITFNDGGDVIAWEGNPILLDGTWQQDAKMLAEVDMWREPVAAFGLTEIATSYVLLEGDKPACRVRECNLGNLLTDALLYQHLRGPVNSSWSDVAIALSNGGGIRAYIQRGTVRVSDVLGAFPFKNEVEKVWITGLTLRGMLEHSVTKLNPDDPPGRFLQMSGIHVAYNLDKPEGSRVRDVMVRCADCEVPRFEPLDNEKTYAIITNSFMVDGGDQYIVLRDNILDREYFGTLMSDAVMEYMTKTSPLIAGDEGRIKFVRDVMTPSTGSALSVDHVMIAIFLVTAWCALPTNNV